jgi:Domain of unknown function (DUF4304)
MSDTQDQMKKALKDVVVPHLRERGFTGSFPHLRRHRPDRIDLLTFQFDRHGGGFIVEIGQCPPEGFTTYWGKQIAPEKVTAWDLSPKQRARVRSRVGSGTDVWFRFDRAASADDFSQTAESVFPFIEQAERMFDDFNHVQRVG